MLPPLKFFSLRGRASVLLVLLLASIPAAAQKQAARIDLPKETISRDGHVKIGWSLKTPLAIAELQQAEDKSFSTAHIIYKGRDNATFISGLDDGSYYFRVREENGEWSPAVAVHVKHHSQELAFTLFGAGAIVFLLTVAVIMKGSFDNP